MSDTKPIIQLRKDYTFNFKIPILFLLFDRPDITQRVFDIIRQVQPRQLFVAADGPRKDYPKDIEKCKQARAIIEQVDWDCELKTLFRDQNLSGPVANPEAITWFFNHVEKGIILEDDCLPDKSFFSFCEELLNYYKNDPEILMISGNNFQIGKKRGNGSYYFSKYPNTWGWATWQRAWKLFSYDISQLDKVNGGVKNRISGMANSVEEQKYWSDIYNKLKTNNIQAWDYKWIFTCWVHNMYAIVPNKNLVKNIGFTETATHTTKEPAFYKKIKLESESNVKHPSKKKYNVKADRFLFKNWFLRKNTMTQQAINIIKKPLRYIFSLFEKKFYLH